MARRSTRSVVLVRLLSAPLVVGAFGCQSPASVPDIEVVAHEYAFSAPDSVDAGPALVHLRSTGKVGHEMILLKLKPGVAVAQLVEAHKNDQPFRPLLDGGNAVLFAGPGSANDARLSVTFESGRDYVLWCNFADGAGQPKHATLGMFKAIAVRVAAPRAPHPATPVRNVMVSTSDYAFQVPDTLPAGVTDFRMRNVGRVPHEVVLSRLRAGISARLVLEGELKGSNVDSLFDSEGVLLTAPAGDHNDVAMRVNLLAGRLYVLECTFQDAADKPPHVALGMFKQITVR